MRILEITLFVQVRTHFYIFQSNFVRFDRKGPVYFDKCTKNRTAEGHFPGQGGPCGYMTMRPLRASGGPGGGPPMSAASGQRRALTAAGGGSAGAGGGGGKRAKILTLSPKCGIL